MKKLILSAGVLSIIIYAIYYQKVYEYYSVVESTFSFKNPLYLWGDITNCTIYSLMALLFFTLGQGEAKHTRILGFNAVGWFWVLLVSTYLFNYLFNQQIQMHRVGIAFIGMFSVSIISLFISCCVQYFKQPRAQ